MKQIEECLERAFDRKAPLKKKWKAFIVDERYLALYHYQHLVLFYDFETKKITREWWEKPADKRGLEAAKAFLLENPDRLPAHFIESKKEEEAI